MDDQESCLFVAEHCKKEEEQLGEGCELPSGKSTPNLPLLNHLHKWRPQKRVKLLLCQGDDKHDGDYILQRKGTWVTQTATAKNNPTRALGVAEKARQR